MMRPDTEASQDLFVNVESDVRFDSTSSPPENPLYKRESTRGYSHLRRGNGTQKELSRTRTPLLVFHPSCLSVIPLELHRTPEHPYGVQVSPAHSGAPP